jgi:hypothetical protein
VEELDKKLYRAESKKDRMLTLCKVPLIGFLIGAGVGGMLLIIWHFRRSDRYYEYHDYKLGRHVRRLKTDQITPILQFLVVFWGIIGYFIADWVASSRVRKTAEYAEVNAEINALKGKSTILLQVIDNQKEKLRLVQEKEIQDRIEEHDKQKIQIEPALESFSPLGQPIAVEELNISEKAKV